MIKILDISILMSQIRGLGEHCDSLWYTLFIKDNSYSVSQALFYLNRFSNFKYNQESFWWGILGGVCMVCPCDVKQMASVCLTKLQTKLVCIIPCPVSLGKNYGRCWAPSLHVSRCCHALKCSWFLLNTQTPLSLGKWMYNFLGLFFLPHIINTIWNTLFLCGHISIYHWTYRVA